MPLYDYVCTDCGRRIEVMHSVNAAGPTTCEQCGGALRKALTPPAIVFKGSGWAKKDARASAPSAAKSNGDSRSSDKKASTEGGDSPARETSKPSTD